MDLNLLFRIVLIIIVIGIAFKSIKFITSVAFKIAFILLFILLFYKIFIGFKKSSLIGYFIKFITCFL